MATGLLDGKVKLVMVIFALASEKVVPQGLYHKPEEKPDGKGPLKADPLVTGTAILDPMEGVSLERFIGDLAVNGYVLVDAFWQMRPGKEERIRPSARFIFATDYGVPGEFAQHRKSAKAALEALAGNTLWMVKSAVNPYFKDGKPREDEFVLTVNATARQPTLNDNGAPVMRWRKNEHGQRIGKPFMLAPDAYLRIEDGEIYAISEP